MARSSRSALGHDGLELPLVTTGLLVLLALVYAQELTLSEAHQNPAVTTTLLARCGLSRGLVASG